MMAKRLGKGISALIPEFPEGTELVYKVAEIDVGKISANPQQPRKEFKVQSMEELKYSIREKGIIQPITVRQVDGGFELIAGERRLRASLELGMATIPAYVLPVSSDVEMMELALVENVQREDLNAVDEAQAYALLANTFNLSHEEISQKVGKDRSTITNSIRLLNLPDPILKDVRDGNLSAGHARPLLTLGSEQQQINLWHRIRRDGLSVRAVEALTKKATDEKPIEKNAPVPQKPPYFQELEEKLMKVIGSRVHIRGNESKGCIEIEFYSREDLTRLIEILDSIEESV